MSKYRDEDPLDTKRLDAMIDGHWAIHTKTTNESTLYIVRSEGGFGPELGRSFLGARDALDRAMGITDPEPHGPGCKYGDDEPAKEKGEQTKWRQSA